MRVMAIQAHIGEGQFPTYMKGTAVAFLEERETRFAHWWACKIEGRDPYIPDIYVSDGKLTMNYNPTELVLEVGEDVQGIVYEWLYAVNEEGVAGWIPAEAVVSVIDAACPS